jgi:para-aminobenzoate synthetase
VKTLIVDNYDSFTFNLYHLIACVNGVEPLVFRNDEITWEQFQELGIDNIVISPGPGRPENDRDFGICRRILLESQKPVFGVCLGLQGLGHLFGGEVVEAPEPVHGRTSSIFHDGSGIFAGIPQGFSAVRYHSLMVGRPVPDCLRVTAWTEDELIMGLEHRERPIWAVQFHPESVCTEFGEELMRNFADLTRSLGTEGRGLNGFNGLKSAQCVQSVANNFLFTRRLDIHPCPERAFCRLFGDESPAFWLDTAIPESGRGRFSFMGAVGGPNSFWLTYSVADRQLVLNRGAQREIRGVSLFDFLQEHLDGHRTQGVDLPFDFNGGFVGYLGYELKADCGAQDAHRSLNPDASLMFVDRFLAFDHLEKAVYLICSGTPDDRAGANEWFDQVEHLLRSASDDSPLPAPRAESIRFSLEQDRQQYLKNIRSCLRSIRAGESYEICLTNRLTARTTVDPLAYYRVLRRFNPAPHSAFLRFPEVSVACSSPELFLEVDRNSVVESKPIKGTAARAADAGEDQLAREMLRTSVKTRSENLMIVDLLRHDLGRVSEVGSIDVPEMMKVETYRNLHQLVSTIRGRLRPDATSIDCVRSAFPGGSMTGAPKLRTMELIDRLETSARGVYSGAIGYLALNGAANLNIVIRTAVFSGGNVSVGAGGAIVALSNPEEEFSEMVLKSRALVDAFRPLVAGDVWIGLG